MQLFRRLKTTCFRSRTRMLAFVLLVVSAIYSGNRVIYGGSRADTGIWRWPELDLGKRSFAFDLPPAESPGETPPPASGEIRRIATGAITRSESVRKGAPDTGDASKEDRRNEAAIFPSHRARIATVDIQSLLTAYTPTDAPESTRNSIREKIVGAVRHYGERSGYPLILDRSGPSLNGVNVVQSADGVADLTEEIREELRRDADER